MRRVLVVSYYTPPLGLSGVMRVTKLCKFLPEFGWRPLVLTVKPAAYYYYDPELLTDLKEVKVYRTESIDPARLLNRMRSGRSRLKPVLRNSLGKGVRLFNYFLFPDSKAGWFPFGSVAGRHIIDQEKPAAIFATAPPFTALLLGVRLKAHAHIPLVVDFRDPWPTGFVQPPSLQRPALRELRRYFVRHADLVLAVNAGTARQVGAETVVLDNGFDPEDFQLPGTRLEGFSIVHVGNLWQNQKEIIAVAEAIQDIPAGADGRLPLLYLAGRMDQITRQELKGNARVRILGTLSHKEVCGLMKGADVLLYLGKPEQPVGIKLYEYLGARRPIVVFGKDINEAARIVADCGAGVTCFDSDSLCASFEQIRTEPSRFTNGGRGRFNRRKQTRWLAEKMESLI